MWRKTWKFSIVNKTMIIPVTPICQYCSHLLHNSQHLSHRNIINLISFSVSDVEIYTQSDLRGLRRIANMDHKQLRKLSEMMVYFYW